MKRSSTNEQNPQRLDLMIDAGLESGRWQYLSQATIESIIGNPHIKNLPLKFYLIGLMATQGYTVARKQKRHPEGLYPVEMALKTIPNPNSTKTKKLPPLHVPMMPADMGQMLVKLTVEWYARHGRELTKAEAAIFRPSRQNSRRALNTVERMGWGARATVGQEPRLLRDLDLASRQKVAGGQKLFLYFFVTPVLSTVAIPDVVTSDYIYDGDDDLRLPPDLEEISGELRRLTGRFFRPEQLSLFKASYTSIEDQFVEVKDAKAREQVARNQRKQAEQRLKERVLAMLDQAPEPAPEAAAILAPAPAVAAQAPERPRRAVTPFPAPAKPPAPANSPAPAVVTADVEAVFQSMKRIAPGADRDGARQLIAKCQAEDPAATAEEILDGITRKKKAAAHYDNPVACLMTAVPKMFSGGYCHREAPAPAPAEETASQAAAAKFAWDIWNDPRASESERAIAKQQLIECGAWNADSAA